MTTSTLLTINQIHQRRRVVPALSCEYNIFVYTTKEKLMQNIYGKMQGREIELAMFLIQMQMRLIEYASFG